MPSFLASSRIWAFFFSSSSFLTCCVLLKAAVLQIWMAMS